MHDVRRVTEGHPEVTGARTSRPTRTLDDGWTCRRPPAGFRVLIVERDRADEGRPTTSSAFSTSTRPPHPPPTPPPPPPHTIGADASERDEGREAKADTRPESAWKDHAGRVDANQKIAELKAGRRDRRHGAFPPQVFIFLLLGGTVRKSRRKTLNEGGRQRMQQQPGDDETLAFYRCGRLISRGRKNRGCGGDPEINANNIKLCRKRKGSVLMAAGIRHGLPPGGAPTPMTSTGLQPL